MQQPQIEGDKPNFFVGIFRKGFLLCSFRGRYETYESAEMMCITFESFLNKEQFFTEDREADYVAVDFVQRYEERDIVANQVDLRLLKSERRY